MSSSKKDSLGVPGFSKDAAPFVPSGGPAGTGTATFKVTAAPFVPGGSTPPGGYTGTPSSAKIPASGSQVLTSNAQPFVPGGHKQAAGGGGTPGSSGQQGSGQGSSSMAGASTPPHFSRQGHGSGAAGSPHRGRASSSNSTPHNSSTGSTLLASPPAGPGQNQGSQGMMLSASGSGSSVPGPGSSTPPGQGFTGGSMQHAASPLGTRTGRGGRGEYTGGRGGRGRAGSFMQPHSMHSDGATASGQLVPGIHTAVSPGGPQMHGTHAHMHARGGSMGMSAGFAVSHLSHGHASAGGSGAGGGRAAGPYSRQGYGLHAHGKPYAPGRANLLSRQFLDEGLRQQLAAAAYAVQAQWVNTARDASQPLLPDRISHYHTLLPLDMPANSSSSAMPAGATGAAALGEAFSPALGVRTLVLKGISTHDGLAYALRRVDGKQVVPTPDVLSCAQQAVEAWAPLAHHPQLVALRAAFVSSELDAAAALFMVYDFHPGCITLAALHLAPNVGAGGVVSVVPPTEAQLWSYLVQLTSLMTAAHACGLALRPSCLHASKVLASPSGRLRVNCCGLVGAVSGEPASIMMDSNSGREELAAAHRADLTALGQLMLALACVGLVPPGHAGNMEVLTAPAGAARVRPELARLIAALLAASDGGPLGSVRQLAAYPAIVEQTFAHLDSTSTYVDSLMGELAKECENGRLLRLLIKLSFVVERPEGDMDGNWAETGDRYLLKLFRDFVFHQVMPEGSTSAGSPLLDWGHVIEALNKLDAGVPERLMLLARDEAAMLIASYADLKRCVEHSYADLQSHAAHSKV